LSSGLDKDNNESGEKTRKHNIYCEIGFFMGIFSLFYSGFVLIPVLAAMFSIAGIVTFKNTRHKDKWKAYWGLFLGTALALTSFV